MSERETIHLAGDLSFLHTDFLWRMPGSWVGYPYYSTSEFYEDIAKTAERGRFDLLFFGDTGGTSEDYGGNYDAVVRNGVKWPRHDMTAMIPISAGAIAALGSFNYVLSADGITAGSPTLATPAISQQHVYPHGLAHR